MKQNNNNIRAKIISWDRLERWSVYSNINYSWLWPERYLKKLKSVTTIRKDKVNRLSLSDDNICFITINFSGDIYIRNQTIDSPYKGQLFYAYSGDIVYSKIDLRNGAIGIIPNNIKIAAVTNEFPVYSIDKDKALPEYIKLLFRTTQFKSIINSMISGASGRKRVQPTDIENLLIPIPTLEIQRYIINYWTKAKDLKSILSSEILKFDRDNEEYLLDSVNIHVKENNLDQRYRLIRWFELERWDNSFYCLDFVELDSQLQLVQHVQLGSILNFLSRPWDKKDFPDGKFKYIEISDVNRLEGIVGFSTVSVNKAPSRATTLIKTGDVLIAKTRPYLGAFAVVQEKYNNCVCSSGFSIADSILHNGFLKDYVMIILKSKIGLLQFERRMTGGLYPAITQNELMKIKIPLVSMDIQRQIIQRFSENESIVRLHKIKTEETVRQINQNIEDMITGKKRIV